MALNKLGVKHTGRMPSDSWAGGDSGLDIDRSGYRAGRVIDGNGLPVGGILIGAINIPTRRIIGHTRSAHDGTYLFEGLRSDTSDYFLFAYPDSEILGGDYDFATRYKIL